jgi:hypothetical protein
VWVLAAPRYTVRSASYNVEPPGQQSLLSLTVEAAGGSDGPNV